MFTQLLKSTKQRQNVEKMFVYFLIVAVVEKIFQVKFNTNNGLVEYIKLEPNERFLFNKKQFSVFNFLSKI